MSYPEFGGFAVTIGRVREDGRSPIAAHFEEPVPAHMQSDLISEARAYVRRRFGPSDIDVWCLPLS